MISFDILFLIYEWSWHGWADGFLFLVALHNHTFLWIGLPKSNNELENRQLKKPQHLIQKWISPCYYGTRLLSMEEHIFTVLCFDKFLTCYIDDKTDVVWWTSLFLTYGLNYSISLNYKSYSCSWWRIVIKDWRHPTDTDSQHKHNQKVKIKQRYNAAPLT